MKKIYLVITSYFPTPESWRCAFIYDQVKTIQQLSQYQVVVVNTDVINDYVYNGVNVIAFKPWRRGLLIFPWLIEWINTRRLLKTLILHGISLNDVMVVHTHLVPNAYLGKGLKKINTNIKTMIQFHDADPFAVLQSERFNFFGLKRIAYFLYHRSLVESTDACVSISKNVTKVALECPRQNVYTTYEPVKKVQRDLRFCRSAHIHKLILLHNGVNMSLFNKGSANRKNLSEEFIIGAIGNFRVLKDYMTLFKALLRIKGKLGKWKLRIIGTGETLLECKNFISVNNMSQYVEFSNEVTHEQLPDFYRSLDLFVLPSYFEGFGCVFTEAWACGTPFITCEGQGMDDMIYTQDKRLWLCKECDFEDLSKKILYFYKNRPVQQLCCDIDIETLIREFLMEIESL
jgi:glycosyltransferase involved in cell wall biosynthesis